MPIRKRRLYFLFLLAVFIVAIPVLMLYGSGYRLDDQFRLVKTGGIYISAPGSGAEIYVNNKIEKTTNLIQRDLFEQNLNPGTYFVFVYKDGYWPWSKELKVHEQLVAEAHPFLVRREPKLEEIPKNLPPENPGRAVSPNPEYKDVAALFSGRLLPATSTLTSKTASATSTVTVGDVKLIRKGSTIYAEWLGNPDRAPYYLCDENKSHCLDSIPVFTSTSKIKTFDFYPGRNDVVILARKNGLYAVEADLRRVQNFFLVYAGSDPDFRVGSDGKVYLKDGPVFYAIEL